MTVEEKYSAVAVKAKQIDIVVFGASCGACFVALVQLSSASTISAALQFAIHSFSFAIPLLAGAVMGRRELLDRARPTLGKEIAIHALGFLGMLAAISGVAAMFFHFSSFAGGAFIATSLVTFAIIGALVLASRP